MRKLTGNLNRARTLCLFTNQIREKVRRDVRGPETQPGGRALKFYASQRLDIRRIETLKEGTEAIGNRVRVKVVKNKVAAPFRQAEFDIEYGLGVSTEGSLLDLGLEHNIVQKSGSFFSYGDERLGQGRNNAKAYLRENPEMARRSRRRSSRPQGWPARAAAPARRRGRPRPAGRMGRLRSPGRTGRASPTGRSTRAARTGARRPARPSSGRPEPRASGARTRRSGRSRSPGAPSPPASGPWPSCAPSWTAGVEPEAAEVAVRELEGAGYLDDLSFAHRFVEDRRFLAGWGTERIARALERRGVGPDLVAAALAPVGEADELEAALLLLARRFPDAAFSDRERARAWRLLVRRGYGSDLAYEAVRRPHVRSRDSAGARAVAGPPPRGVVSRNGRHGFCEMKYQQRGLS